MAKGWRIGAPPKDGAYLVAFEGDGDTHLAIGTYVEAGQWCGGICPVREWNVPGRAIGSRIWWRPLPAAPSV